MLSAMGNKLRQGIKMQQDVPVWLKQDFRGNSESSTAHKTPNTPRHCKKWHFFKNVQS